MPQSYYLGGKIRAADFNLFADDINDIVGIGTNDPGTKLDVVASTTGKTAVLWTLTKEN